MVKNAYIDFKLNNLYMLINPSHKIYLEEGVCYCFEIYIKYRIFNNRILVCDILNNWWKLISLILHLDKSHIKYNYLSNTFIISDFEFGIKLETNLLTKFNFEFYNGLILNQLSITNGLSFKRENYNKSLKFSNCKFNKEFCIARINISKQIVFENIYFLENVFIEWVNFNENSYLRLFKCSFKKQCDFKYNIFYNEIDFLDIYAKELILEQNIFNKFLYIQNSTINNINLWKNKFENRCYFMDSIFGNKNNENIKLNFSNAHFRDNVYFNNSIFKNYADFHECEFEKIANFYGVRFDKAPNFSQVIFKGNLNAVNMDLNFGFNDLNKRIRKEYKSYEEQRTKEPNIYQEKSIDKFANDFRDSFRNFKNALIKDNNSLDASNFHKCELYCKEIELNNKKDKTFKDKIDEWQLIFYRKLCDHHTNLLLNAKWFIYIVALYVLLLGKMTWWIYLILITIFLASIYLCKIKNIWLNLSSITVSVAIVYCPNMIFGFTNLFIDNLNYWQNLITAVYVVIIALVLFSLQKTARKNSVVPS